MRSVISARAFFYIFYSLFWPFVLSLISFVGLILILQFIKKSELLLLDSSDLSLSLKFFFLGSLSYIPLIIPFCLLLGVLFGYGKLSSNHELTAFSNLGYSKIALATPAMLLTLACFLICSSSIHSWGPKAKAKSKFIESLLHEKLALTALQPGVFLNNLPNAVFYSEEINNSSKKLKRVFLLTGQDQDQAKFIFSDTGSFIDSPETDESFKLLLDDGQLYGQDKQNRSFIVDYKTYAVSLFKNQDLDFISSKPTYLTSKRLKKFKPIKHKIEYDKRIVLSLTCFLFFALALLFSVKLHSRSSSGKGFVIAIFLSLIFWIVLFVSEHLAITNELSIIMYSPIFIFTLIVLSLYYWNKSKFII